MKQAMDINRDNYEHYFLLYIDNELTAAERLAVEAFVQAHTDLAQELQMLQQTVLMDEAVSFSGKEALLKTAPARQEELLLLLDGELPATAAAALHNDIQADAQLQQEWTVLQQTRLPQETITFEHKDLLRRKPARIIPVQWLRAAAAVLVFGVLGTVLVLNSNSKSAGGESGVAKGSSTTEKMTGSGPGSIPAESGTAESSTTGTPIVTGTENGTANTTATTSAPAAIAPVTNGGSTAQQPAATTAQDAKSIARSSAEKRTAPAAQNSPAPENNTAAVTNTQRLENFNSAESNKTNTAAVTPSETITLPAAKNPVTGGQEREAVKASIETSLKQNSNAVYAVNTPDAAETYDQLAPDDRRFRRSGLARKVSRFFQRSRKKADGDGLKIAGFEFAVR